MLDHIQSIITLHWTKNNQMIKLNIIYVFEF